MKNVHSALPLAVLFCGLSHAQIPIWTPTSPMQLARFGAGATILPSGRVLVVGGHLTSGDLTAEAEIYDPKAATWIQVLSLPTPHAPAVSRLLTGEVLIAGDDVNSNQPTAYVYVETTNNWLPTGPPTTARYQPALALLPNGKVLMSGGYNGIVCCPGKTGTFLTAELYDRATNTWTAAGSMFTRRFGHAATTLPSGKVLVTGGALRDPIEISNAVEVYDQAADSWLTLNPMFTARSGHTATVLASGKVLVTGGYATSFDTYTASAEIYDPVFGTWARANGMTTARALHTATLLPSGKVLISGGQNGAGPLSTAEIYDPIVGTWSPASQMVTPRAQATATLLPDGSILEAGGVSANVTVTAKAETFRLVPNLGIAPFTLPPAAIGSPYSFTFSATDGLGPYSWAANGMPTWLSITLGGTLSGTPPPNAPNSVQFSVIVSDSLKNTATAAVTLKINLPVVISPSQLPSALENILYSVGFGATGGTGQYKWSATGLPSWLTMSGAGTLSGVAPFGSGGTFPIAVTATDSAGAGATLQLQLLVVTAGKLRITTATQLPAATAGTYYSRQLAPTGGTPPYRWAEAVSLVPGLTLNSAGVLSGTPISDGDSSFTTHVTDSTGATVFALFSLNVNPAPLTIATPSPLADGVMGVPYSQNLIATGGKRPITWNSQGALPGGLTFTGDGTLNGIPTVNGSFSISVSAISSDGVAASTKFQFTIHPSTPSPALSAGSLAFNAVTNGSVPLAQSVSIVTTYAPLPGLTFTAHSDVPWIVFTPPTGIMPTIFKVGINQSNMGPGLYRGNITINSTNPIPNAVPTFVTSLPVTLTIANAPPSLAIAPATLSLFQNAAATLALSNTGSGPVNYRVSSVDLAGATVTPSSGTLAPNTTAMLSLSIDALQRRLLGSALSRGHVQIDWDGGSTSSLVTVFYGSRPRLYLSDSGTTLNAVEVAGLIEPGTQSFTVLSSDPTPIQYDVQQADSNTWLTLNTTSGIASNSKPGTVSFTVNTDGLRNGVYYSVLRVTSNEAINTPRDFVVVLNVVTAGAPPTPSITPGGLLFVATPNTAPPAQNVQVFSNLSTNLSLQFSTTTDDGANWLSAKATTVAITTASPATLQVSVDASKLKPGVYHGRIGVSLGTETVRSSSVTLVVPSAPCLASGLAIVQTGLQDNFILSAGWPTSISAAVVDNCGHPVPGATLSAQFSNGDPQLQLNLLDPSIAWYAASYYPANPSSGMIVTLLATAPGLDSASATIQGETDANNVPALRSDGPLHIFNPRTQDPLAPGTVIQMYGSNLVNPTAAPAGPFVVISGVRAPTFFSAPGQINSMIPYELDPTREYELRINQGNAYSGPATFIAQPLTPGIATLLDGHVIAQHTNYALVTADAPAQPCETLTLYLAGLGPVDFPILTSDASPFSPLANVLNVPTVMLNGSLTSVSFAGLTPGAFGLYQINFQVPKGTPSGDQKLEISEAGIPANVSLLPVGQQPVCQ